MSARTTVVGFVLATTMFASACSSGNQGGGTSALPGGPLIGPPSYAAIDPAKAVRAAVVLGSCAPDDGPDRILDSMYARRQADDFTTRLYNGAIECLASNARGCQAMTDCLSTVIDNGGPCTDGCEGQAFTGCDGSLRIRSNCARFGMTCSADLKDVCVPTGTPEACDPTTFVPACVDGAPTECRSPGVQRGLRCADYGLVCGEVSPPSPPASPGFFGCKGTGAACTNGVTTLNVDFRLGDACDGTKLSVCANGAQAMFDCTMAAPGFTCQTGAGTPSFFCGSASECSPGGGTPATCDGDTIVLCNGGKLERIDCKSLGFSGCNAKAAVCSPSPWPT